MRTSLRQHAARTWKGAASAIIARQAKAAQTIRPAKNEASRERIFDPYRCRSTNLRCAMKLFMMRHGVAEDPGKDDQVPDFDRALTMRGRKRIRHIGRTLRESWVLPDLIVASPVVRALQTAEIIAATLDPDEPVIVRRELAPGGDIITLVRELVASDIESALLVGHEPSLSEFVASVLGAENGPGSFSKGMIVAIRVASEGGIKPLFMLDPKSLEQIPL